MSHGAASLVEGVPGWAVLRRIGMLLLGSVGTALLAFATQWLLTRGMSVASYGRIAAWMAAVNIATPLAVLGTGWFWLELYGREGHGAMRWLRPALQVSAVAYALAAVLLVAYAASTDGGLPSGLIAAVLLAPVLLGQSLAESTAARLQLEERYLALAGWQMLTQCGRTVVVVLLFMEASLELLPLVAGYALVGVLTGTLSAASVVGMLGGRLRLQGHAAVEPPSTQVPRPTMAAVGKAALPYSLVTFLYLVYSQGIVSTTHALLGDEAAANYNVAFLISAAVYLIPNVIYMKFLASKLLRWWSHDRAKFDAAFRIGLAAHGILGALLGLLVAAISVWLVPAVFGPSYAPASDVLSILAIAIPLRFVQHAYGSVLFTNENVRLKIACMGSAAVISVLLTVVLVPVWGLQGAAGAAVLSEALLLVLYVVAVTRRVPGLTSLSAFHPEVLRLALQTLMADGRASDVAQAVPAPAHAPRDMR